MRIRRLSKYEAAKPEAAKPGEHLHEDIAARMFEAAKRNAWR